MIHLLALTLSAVQVSENLMIYPIVPNEAEQGWKLELFQLAEPTPVHYHKIQRQIILVAEGDLWAICGDEEPILLQCGQTVCIDPGVIHSLIPKGTARFFTFDLPGFTFPEDVYYDTPIQNIKWTVPNTKFQPSLDPRYFGSRHEGDGYAVYNLIDGTASEGRWSVALIELQDVPRHFHQIEKEIFIVVNGELDIEIDGTHQIVTEGESIQVFPGNVHHLKSKRNEPVRVLCFNFPAFDPEDMFYIK